MINTTTPPTKKVIMECQGCHFELEFEKEDVKLYKFKEITNEEYSQIEVKCPHCNTSISIIGMDKRLNEVIDYIMAEVESMRNKELSNHEMLKKHFKKKVTIK